MLQRETWHFYTSVQLDYDESRSGEYARAYCPVHGGDKQKSLKINLKGEYEGFGHCFNCKARVLVVDLNPKAARNLGYEREIPTRLHMRMKKTKEPSRDLRLLQEYLPHMQRALSYDRPRAYLEQRGVPFDLAQRMGVVYLPVIAPEKMTPKLKMLTPWHDRLIFPLGSTEGVGFIGRTLLFWTPGMDENEHRRLLKEHDDVKTYYKTSPAGYFNYDIVKVNEYVYVVEGVFDALACLLIGIESVIAICGISIDATTLPSKIRRATLALDGDERGIVATKTAKRTLRRSGIMVDICSVPQDGQGKDWSERYRLHGTEGLAPLLQPAVERAEDATLLRTSAAEQTKDEESYQCADCATLLADFDDREFFFVQIDESSVACYCSRCRDDQGQRLCPQEKDASSDDVESLAQPAIQSAAAMEQPTQEPDGLIATVEGIVNLLEAVIPGATYVVDLETTGLDPRKHKIVSIAVGTPGNVWIIDMRPYYSLPEAGQAEWREALQILFRQDVTWAGHNLKFDLSYLALQCDVQLRGLRVYDTMLVERLIHAGLRASASMQATAERYQLSVTKAERAWFPDLDKRLDEWNAPFPEVQLAYMKQDIELPHIILDRQRVIIEQQDLTRVVALENEALPAVVAMEVHGVLVDTEHWRNVLAAKKARLAELEEHIQQALGKALTEAQSCVQQGLFSNAPVQVHVNLSSTEEVSQALGILGVPVNSIAKEALEVVRGKHEVIEKMLEWRKVGKFVSAFGESLLSYVRDDGRIHATCDQLGAASGRIICREPNLQQIPKSKDEDEDIRRCFVAPPGHTLLIADLSNIELRILADVSGDETMLKFFAEGKDLHSETARLMFNLAPEINPEEYYINGVKVRDIAKTINFGLAYGMGAQGLANRVKGCTMERAKTLMQTYFATYRDVEKYLKVSGRDGVKRGYAVSLAGRRRNFSKEELADHTKRGAAERSAKNHPIQATNADILKRALALLYSQLPSTVRMVMTIHDELVLECPLALQEEAAQLLSSCMDEACKDFLHVVRIKTPKVLVSPFWVK